LSTSVSQTIFPMRKTRRPARRPLCRKPHKTGGVCYIEFEKTPSSTKGDLRMGCWLVIFPNSRHHTSNHQQSATMQNGRKKEKSLHLAARASATPPTQAPKSKVLNPVFDCKVTAFDCRRRQLHLIVVRLSVGVCVQCVGTEISVFGHVDVALE
jgi:hypothetical protein